MDSSTPFSAPFLGKLNAPFYWVSAICLIAQDYGQAVLLWNSDKGLRWGVQEGMRQASLGLVRAPRDISSLLSEARTSTRQIPSPKNCPPNTTDNYDILSSSPPTKTSHPIFICCCDFFQVPFPPLSPFQFANTLPKCSFGNEHSNRNPSSLTRLA